MSERGHIAGIDGLRAIAAGLVLAMHWIPAPLLHGVPTGRWGVRLFFVISGFLITGILLRLRGQPISGALKTFYARRFLRIFPLYYAVLASAALMGAALVIAEFPWHALYGSNLLFAAKGAWSGYTDPFWSLAVEEQFYLVWPLVMLLAPARWVAPIIIGAVILAPLSRLGLHLAGVNGVAVRVLPTSCLDTLGCGALLGYARWVGRDVRPLLWPAALVGLTGSLALLGLELLTSPYHWAVMTFGDLASAALFTGALGFVVEGHGLWLRFRPLAYLGTISYGVYLIHMLVQQLPVGGPLALRVVVWGALTVGLASLSWFAFERPINSLKRYLPYDARSPQRPQWLPLRSPQRHRPQSASRRP